jgi:hypothetical protein
LLGCRYQSICACLGLPLRRAVPMHAARWDRSLVRHQALKYRMCTDIPQGLAPPFEFPLPPRAELLLHHHLSRLQRPTVPPPHRTPTSTSRRYGDTVVRFIIRFQHVDTFRASVMGGRQAAEKRLGCRITKKRSNNNTETKIYSTWHA